MANKDKANKEKEVIVKEVKVEAIILLHLKEIETKVDKEVETREAEEEAEAIIVDHEILKNISNLYLTID